MNRKDPIIFFFRKKWIACATAVLFSAVNTSFAQPAASLAFDQKAESLSTSIPADLKLPESLGSVETLFHSTQAGRPFVAVIQDAHAILDAQTNIREIIQYLQTQYGIRLITLEGGAGKLDPTLFQTFPDPFVKKKIFADYLKRGELTGAESAAVLNSEEAQYYGMEDWKLYENHYLAYLRAVEKKESVLMHLETLRSRLDQERLKVYSPKINQFHENLEKFEKENVYLLEMLNFLGTIEGTRQRLAHYPDLEKLFRAYDFEKDRAQDKSTLETRVRQMANTFKANYLKRMNIKQEMAFHRNYQAFVTGQMEGAAFLKYLIETGESFGVKARLTPSLLKVLGHHETLATIKGTRLFEELQSLIFETQESLMAMVEERGLAEKYRKLKILENLVSLELTRTQWDAFQKDPESYFSLLGDKRQEFQYPLEFYRLALERDQAFRRNLTKLLKEQKANAVIVIAGGFHTQGFEKSLKEEGLSFSIITPKIQSLEGRETYASVMQGNLSYKPYLRTTFYDAFAKDSSIKLVNELGEPDFRKSMKLWRDEVIRKLSREGKVSKAREYTRYIDLVYAIYHEKFGRGNRSGRSREEILEAIDHELKDFTDESVSRRWQKLEWQINQLGVGLKSLVAQRELRFDRIASLVNQVRQTQPTTLGPVLKLNPQSPSISEMSPVIKTLILEGKLLPETRIRPFVPPAKGGLLPATKNRLTGQTLQKTVSLFANESKIRLGKMEITQGKLKPTASRAELRAFADDQFPDSREVKRLAAKQRSLAPPKVYNDIFHFARRVSDFYRANKLSPGAKGYPDEYLQQVTEINLEIMRGVLVNVDERLYLILKSTLHPTLNDEIKKVRNERRKLEVSLNSAEVMGHSKTTLAAAEDPTKVDKRTTRPGQTKPAQTTSEVAAEALRKMGIRTPPPKRAETVKAPAKKTEEVYPLAPEEPETETPDLVPTTIDIPEGAEQPTSWGHISDEQVPVLRDQITEFLNALADVLKIGKGSLIQHLKTIENEIRNSLNQFDKNNPSIISILEMMSLNLEEIETGLDRIRGNLKAREENTRISQLLIAVAALVSQSIELRAAISTVLAPKPPEVVTDVAPEPAPVAEVGLERLDTDEKRPAFPVEEIVETESTSMLLGVGDQPQTDAEIEALMKDIEEEDTVLEEPIDSEALSAKPASPDLTAPKPETKVSPLSFDTKAKIKRLPPAPFTLHFLERFRSNRIEDLNIRDTEIENRVLNGRRSQNQDEELIAFGLTALMAIGIFGVIALIGTIFTGVFIKSAIVGGVAGILLGAFIWPWMRPSPELNKFKGKTLEYLFDNQYQELKGLLKLAEDEARDRGERLAYVHMIEELGKRLEVAVSAELSTTFSENLKNIQEDLKKWPAELKRLKVNIPKTKGPRKSFLHRLWQRMFGTTILLEYPAPQKDVQRTAVDSDIIAAAVVGTLGTLLAAFFVSAIGGIMAGIATGVISGGISALILVLDLRAKASPLATPRRKRQPPAPPASQLKPQARQTEVDTKRYATALDRIMKWSKKKNYDPFLFYVLEVMVNKREGGSEKVKLPTKYAKYIGDMKTAAGELDKALNHAGFEPQDVIGLLKALRNAYSPRAEVRQGLLTGQELANKLIEAFQKINSPGKVESVPVDGMTLQAIYKSILGTNEAELKKIFQKLADNLVLQSGKGEALKEIDKAFGEKRAPEVKKKFLEQVARNRIFEVIKTYIVPLRLNREPSDQNMRQQILSKIPGVAYPRGEEHFADKYDRTYREVENANLITSAALTVNLDKAIELYRNAVTTYGNGRYKKYLNQPIEFFKDHNAWPDLLNNQLPGVYTVALEADPEMQALLADSLGGMEVIQKEAELAYALHLLKTAVEIHDPLGMPRIKAWQAQKEGGLLTAQALTSVPGVKQSAESTRPVPQGSELLTKVLKTQEVEQKEEVKRSEVRDLQGLPLDLTFNMSEAKIQKLLEGLERNSEVAVTTEELTRDVRSRLEDARNRLSENREHILTVLREAREVVAEVFSEKFDARVKEELDWANQVGLIEATDVEAIIWRMRAITMGETIATMTEGDIRRADEMRGISDAALEAFQTQLADEIRVLKTTASHLRMNIVIVEPQSEADRTYVEFALSLLKEFIDTAEVMHTTEQKPNQRLRNLGKPVIHRSYDFANYKQVIQKINDKQQDLNGEFPVWFITNGLQLSSNPNHPYTSLRSKLDRMPERLKKPFIAAADRLLIALYELRSELRQTILNDATGEKLRHFIEEQQLGLPNTFVMEGGNIAFNISGLIQDIKARAEIRKAA